MADPSNPVVRPPGYHSRWVHALFLLLAIGMVTWAFLLLAGEAQTGHRIGLLGLAPFSVAAWLRPWLLVALAAAAGVLVKELAFTSYHGFNLQDFDWRVIPRDWIGLVAGVFVSLVFFGLGSLILPGEILPAGHLTMADARILAVAFLLGYFSEEAFRRLYEFVKSYLLKAEVGPPLGLGYANLLGADWPILALGDVAGKLGLPAAEVQQAVRCLAAEGVPFSHVLLGAFATEGKRRRFAEQNNLDGDVLEDLYRFADLLRVTASPEAAADLLRKRPGLSGNALLDEVTARKPVGIREATKGAAASSPPWLAFAQGLERQRKA